MHRLLCLSALVCLVCLSCLSAHATSFTFSYYGSGITASGNLDAVLQSNGSYLVDAISGSRNGVSLASLDPVNTFGSNDNQMVTTGVYFTFSGLSFQTVGGAQYNIYSSGAIDKETLTGNDDGTPITVSIKPAAVTPEPSTLLLMGTGLMGLVGVSRRWMVSA